MSKISDKLFSKLKARPFDKLRARSSFTLIELLVVIGILAILTAAVIIILNPAEYLKQTRDVTRMNDLGSINQALNVLETQGVTNFGLANTVYVSIPDSTSTCANLGLPTLPSNYSYHCVSTSTLQSVNGTGWIPVDFTQSPTLSFSSLPIDPINSTSTGDYYTYTSGGSWELDAIFESNKYRDNTTLTKSNLPGVYAKGNNLTLSPIYNNTGLVGYWPFDEGSGTTAYDKSGNGNNGTWSGATPYYTSGKIGSYAGNFNGTNDYVYVGTSNLYNFSNAFTLVAWVKTGCSGCGHQIITRRDGSTSFAHYQLQLLSGTINFGWYNGSWTSVSASSTSADNTWQQVALVYNTYSSITIYDNGASVFSGPGASSLVQNSTKFCIGAICDGSESFKGQIDDVRAYSRALSASEISALYNATK